MKKLFICLFTFLICMLFVGCSSYDIIYPNANEYSVGDAVITDKVENIDIEWISGCVVIDSHGEDSIKLTEISNKELTDDYRVHWYLDGTTLRIKFAKSGVDFNLLNNVQNKQLVLSLPKNFIAKDVKIETASANVKAEFLQADNIEIESASGNIDLKADNVCELDIESASGKVYIDALTADNVSVDTASGAVVADVDNSEKLEIDSSSGKVEINGQNIKKIYTETSSGKVSVNITNTYDEFEIASSSGDIKLVLPETVGFKLDYDTSSGDLDNDFAVVTKGKTQIYGDGYAKISVDTGSGNLSVKKQ